MKKYILPVLALTPFLALAVGYDITSLVEKIRGILNIIIPLLIAIAVVVFLFGVVKYVTSGGSEEKRVEARNTMIWGIVGLFVMVAVWGLVAVLVNTFNFQTTPVSPPSF